MNFNQVSPIGKIGFIKHIVWLGTAIVVATYLLGSSLRADKTVMDHPIHKMAEVDTLKTIPAIPKAESVKYLGFTTDNTFLMVVDYSTIGGAGSFKWIDPISGRVVRSVPTGHLNPLTPTLSSDGKRIFGLDDSILLLGRIGKANVVNHVRIFRSIDLKPIKVVDVGPSRSALGVSEVTGDPKRIVVRTYSLVPYEGSFTSANPGLELWDWQQDRLIRRLNYHSASRIASTLQKSGDNKLSCLFLDGQQNIAGSLQVLNSVNGERLWWTRGDSNRPVSDPVFYLPDGSIVSKDTVYDFTSFAGKPLLPEHPGWHCVSGALCRFGYLFFQSENGLQLWDIHRQTAVQRWPGLHHTVMVFISPDQTTLAVLASPDSEQRIPISYMTHIRIQFFRLGLSLLKNKDHLTKAK